MTHITHTHTHTHTQTDRQTMACMGSCGATAGASTPQRSVVSLLLSLGWLGMLTACFQQRLALAPTCAHDRLPLTRRSDCAAVSLFAFPIAHRSLAYACLLMLVLAAYRLTAALCWHGSTIWSFWIAIALYGAPMGSQTVSGISPYTHAREKIVCNGRRNS